MPEVHVKPRPLGEVAAKPTEREKKALRKQPLSPHTRPALLRGEPFLCKFLY